MHINIIALSCFNNDNDDMNFSANLSTQWKNMNLLSEQRPREQKNQSEIDRRRSKKKITDPTTINFT